MIHFKISDHPRNAWKKNKAGFHKLDLVLTHEFVVWTKNLTQLWWYCKVNLFKIPVNPRTTWKIYKTDAPKLPSVFTNLLTI